MRSRLNRHFRHTRLPLLLALSLVAALLGQAWLSGQQTVVPAVERGVAALTRLQQRVAQSVAEQNRQELRRLSILDRLEFIPRFPLPGPRDRFPRLCLLPIPTPAGAIDPHRSLFVHDRGTLDAAGVDFSFNRTLKQLAGQVVALVPGTTPVTIFRQFWDTQNAAPGVTTGPHCTDNGTMINGFPINCPRNEGQEAIGTDATLQTRIDEYKVLALVNRLDLAHQGWRNCGEHRMVYGKRGNGKNLVILEAVLPNPRPGCREGCLPVAEFWTSLSTIDDPVTRAKALENFFYNGLPGFRPVVHVDHYSAAGVTSGYGSSGSGQIRTNQFLQTVAFQPWILKEFKTVIDCGVSPCTFQIVPTMVKVNPHGPLWNEDNPDPRAPDFQADTLAQKASLASGALTGIGYGVDIPNDAGQSMSLVGPGFVDNYRDEMNAAAALTFRAALVTGALTADQMANRALSQSCAGCHHPATFGINLPNAIGTVTTPVGSPVPVVDSWPAVASAGFVHVDVFPPSVRPELAANPAAYGTGMGQEISPALLDFFLPERKNFLLGQLNAARCPCPRRFIFLDLPTRRRAAEIERRIGQQFDAKIEALDRKVLELQGIGERDKPPTTLLGERAQLVAEREKTLAAELERAGIKLPDAEQLNLRPQPMKLGVKTAAERIAAVNRLLRQEPPRKTVTGSFRPH